MTIPRLNGTMSEVVTRNKQKQQNKQTSDRTRRHWRKSSEEVNIVTCLTKGGIANKNKDKNNP